MPAELDSAKYVSFVTYKKDGTPIATPVWVVPFDGGYAFTTAATAYKVRRIKNDARATLTVCDRRGKVTDGAITHIGSAVLLDAKQTDEVSRLITKKYPIGMKLLDIYEVIKKVIGKGADVGDAAIKVTLHS